MKQLLPILLASCSICHAAISISLPGTTESSEWDQLNSSNSYWGDNAYPVSYPDASTAWPMAISANAPGSTGSAEFNKESGGGYFASASIYDAGSASTFSISDGTPIVGMETIIFQADVGTSIGTLPTLNYNGGTQALAPDFSTITSGEYSSIDFATGDPIPTQNYAWQWDLSGISVSSYEVLWGSTANNHLTTYELNLATGDTFTQVIPETSSVVLISLGSLVLLRRRRS